MLIHTYDETARDTINLDIMMNFLAKQDSKLKRSLKLYQRDLDKSKIRRNNL
jgi:hypothetical protein